MQDQDTETTGSISHNQMNYNGDFDPTTGGFDASFLENLVSTYDAVVASPDVNLSSSRVEEDSEEENSNEGINSCSTMAKPKRNRARTLVSERKRRGQMKEKLHELRSLVPNITKMDKASIIMDSVDYVRGLQTRIKDLVEEITVLEEIEKCGNKRMIMGVTAREAGEGRFYASVECNKGDGVASSLYHAVESLDDRFQMGSSSLSVNSDRFELTLSLHVRGLGEVMTASTVELWVMVALLEEGFGFEMCRQVAKHFL